MFDLVIICFETGEPSVPYWQEMILVDHSKMDYCTLGDYISKYLCSSESNNKEYEEMAIDMMNASGWQWEWFAAGASVQEVYTYWV